jgi:hypothetical protein
LPPVVFCTEEEIDEQDCHGGRGDGDDGRGEREKAKGVVGTRCEDRREKEVTFDEGCAEGEDP